MKKILFFFLLIPFLTTAQRMTDRYMTLRCFITQVGISNGKPVISANCTDFAGTYDALDVSVGDTLFFADGGQGYKLPIDSVLTPGTPTVVFRADWTGLGVVYIPTGTGAIYEVTPDGLNATVAGLPESENQYLIEDLVNQIGTGMDTLYADTIYFKRGGNNFNVTDVKLGNTDNTGLSIITNNTKRVTVTAGGNVGIGTTSPAGKLDVSGAYFEMGTKILDYPGGTNTNTLIVGNSNPTLSNAINNTIVGWDAGRLMTTGSTNTAIGSGALENLTTGNSTVAIGYFAGRSLVNNNPNQSSSSSVFIGYDTRGNGGNLNQIVIGTNAESMGSNSAVIGNANRTDSTQLFGKLKLFDYTGTNYNIAAPASIATFNSSGDVGKTAVLPVANGGTGATSLSGAGIATTATGTTDYIPKYTGSTSLGNGPIFANSAGGISLGTTTAGDNSTIYATKTVNNTTRTINFHNLLTNSNSTNVNQIYETFRNELLISGSYNSTNVGLSNRGLSNFILYGGASGGNHTGTMGIFSQFQTVSGSAVNLTNAYNLNLQLVANSTTATINDYASIFIQQAGLGTITNNYGININNLTGTNVWGIYQAGSDDNNWFAGKVGIGAGKATPTQQLEVTGNIFSDGTNAQFLGDDAVNSVTTPTYSFSGDTDNGIYRPAADNIGLVTNGTERIRVTSAGNVGIGTTAPGASLLTIKNTQEPVRTTIVATQGFAADTTNWTKGAGWTFNGTQAVATAATGNLTYTPTITVTSGNAYEVTYTMSGYTSGVCTLALGNATYVLPSLNVTNNVVLVLPTSGSGGLRFTTSTFTGNLDNVSVVEISNPAPVLLSGQDDGSNTLYSSLRMPNSNTYAIGGGGSFTTGTSNIFMGENAGTRNTTGRNNNFYGAPAGLRNTTGSNNNFFGVNTGGFNTIGNHNNFFGESAGESNVSGSSNSFFGLNSGKSNISGSNNNFFGVNSGNANTTGTQNNFFGEAAGAGNTTGNHNIFHGFETGRSNTTGFQNIAIGRQAGYNPSISTTGSNNILLGTYSGDNISGAATGNVVIGNQLDLPTAAGNDQLVISNLIFGTGASGTGTTIPADGRIGIGKNAPTERLDVSGNTYVSGQHLGNAAAGVSAPAFSFSGDVNTGIYRPGTERLGFVTNGIEKMRIDSVGRVGIGITTPLHTLHLIAPSVTEPVAGDAYSTLIRRDYTNNNASSSLRRFGGRNEVRYYGNQPYTNTSAFSNGVEIHNSSSSNVVNALTSYPEIAATGNASIVRSFMGYIGLNNTVTTGKIYDGEAYAFGGTTTNLMIYDASLQANNGTITNTYGYYCGDITRGTQTNQAYSFYASDVNARNYFGGNVGIGTTSPTSRLHLAGNLSAASWGTAGIQFNSDAATFTNTSTAASGTVASAVFNSFERPTLAATNASVTTTDAATVYIENSPANGTNQTITNPYALWVDEGESRFDGNVGIGGSNPAYPLDINATSAIRLPNGNNSERPTVATATFRYNNSVHHTEFSDGIEWYTMVSAKNLIKQTRIAAATTIASADLTTFEYVIIANMTVGSYQITIPDAAATHLNKKIIISRYTTSGNPNLTIDNVGGGTDTFVSDNDLVDDIVLVHNVDSQITLMCMETATNTYKWVQISK